jgi:hypothetical protein
MLYILCYVRRIIGRAIAQAVSPWLPIAVAWVQAWVLSCGICGGQSGAGAGFLRVLRFPQPIFIPPIAQQSPSSILLFIIIISGVGLSPLVLWPRLAYRTIPRW